MDQGNRAVTDMTWQQAAVAIQTLDAELRRRGLSRRDMITALTGHLGVLIRNEYGSPRARERIVDACAQSLLMQQIGNPR